MPRNKVYLVVVDDAARATSTNNVVVEGLVAAAYSTRENAQEAIRDVLAETRAKFRVFKFYVDADRPGTKIYVAQFGTIHQRGSNREVMVPPLVGNNCREMVRLMAYFFPGLEAEQCALELDDRERTLRFYLDSEGFLEPAKDQDEDQERRGGRGV